MKIILPYKKEVLFKDNLDEVTSISLEHQLSINDNLIKGSFLVTGEYLVSKASKTVLPFSLDLPVALSIEDNYDTTKANLDIDDFYYEIINNQKLVISIDLSVDKLKEREMIDINRDIDILDERCIDDTDSELIKKVLEIDPVETEVIKEEPKENIVKEVKQEKKEIIKEAILDDPNSNTGDKVNSLFQNNNMKDTYTSYNIYILREGDTVDDILSKYNIDIDSLKEYNDLSNLQLGDKIIIPSR